MHAGQLPNRQYSVSIVLAVLFLTACPSLFAQNCANSVINSPTFFGPGPAPIYSTEEVLGSVAPLLGPVKVKTRKWGDRFQLVVERKNENKIETIISATLAKTDESTVSVKWLEINAVHQNFSPREHRGLPIEVFKHLKDIVVKGVKAEGFRFLIATHPKSFSVANLYMRSGFKPINTEAENYYRSMSDRYAQARKFLPDEFKPKNFYDFEFLLRREYTLVHDDFLTLGQKAGIKDDKGKVIAVVLKLFDKNHVFLLDKNREGKLCQLEWGMEMDDMPGGSIRRAPHLILDLQ